MRAEETFAVPSNKNSYRTIDLFNRETIVLPSRSALGRLPEAHRRRSGMRRPRIGFAGQFPGGPGQPSGPTTGVCLQWLDGAGCAGAKAPPIREAPLKGVLPSRNGRTAPGTEIAAGGAPGGAFPRSQGERERSQSVPGDLRIAQEASQASAFPGALLPIWGGSTWSGRRNDRPRPGLTTNGRAERWLRRSAQRRRGLD